jgi:hypothetical protein
VPNGLGTDGTEVAVGQVAAGLHHQFLHGGIGAASLVRGVRVVGPIDAIQTLAFGPLHPEGHRGDSDTEPAGDGTQRLTTADGGYQGTTPLGLTLCLLMGLSPDGSALGEL